MKPLELRLPTNRPPYIQEELLEKAEWLPYPKTGPVVIFFPHAIKDVRYHLYTVATDILPLVLSGSPDESPLPGYPVLDAVAKLQGLGDIEQRLLRWYQGLSPEVSLGDERLTGISGDQINLQ